MGLKIGRVQEEVVERATPRSRVHDEHTGLDAGLGRTFREKSLYSEGADRHATSVLDEVRDEERHDDNKGGDDGGRLVSRGEPGSNSDDGTSKRPLSYRVDGR